MRNSPKTAEQFEKYVALSDEEREIISESSGSVFNIRATPYYLSLLKSEAGHDPLRKIVMPHRRELSEGAQAMLDPLGEKKNNPVHRVIHRYPDRALFLITDVCSVYCRFCTRKHFTGQEQAFLKDEELNAALEYFRAHREIREVILSGGDPLTVSNSQLEKVLKGIREIEHIEIIRIGTRMPVVCPMRVDSDLARLLREYAPVFVMTHFNHPRELTLEAHRGLSILVDHGIPVFNQMVLLNGVNNHPVLVQALSRKLLLSRVKPYYMFQCDPSMGTDHLRTSVEESLEIQKSLWGKMSGLAMPNLSLDIPDGGGKVGLVPEFETYRDDKVRKYTGWDGRPGEYRNPDPSNHELPGDWMEYLDVTADPAN